jgi:L-ascorbate metabolism protein UlaG (beta-lactamase superfamily)
MNYSKSDHYDGERFFNPSGPELPGLADVLKWKLASGKNAWPQSIPNKKPNLQHQVELNETFITSIGHITHLIQVHGCSLLTDPVFSDRASPVQWAGPKRVRPPAITIAELPKVHLVLVSHNHYDHMDLNSLKEIHRLHDPVFIVPLGNAKDLQSVGITKIEELDWWQSTTTAGLGIQCVPAQHWSSRTPTDRNLALWCGFVIDAHALKIYFAGDSGYGPHFNEIAKRAGPIDVSLLPIGAYEPRWFMKGQHMNPDDAVKAHIDLSSTLSIGTHFGTFQLTDEAVTAPVDDLKVALLAMNVSAERFPAPEPGEVIYFKKT